jgi:hypothetical protein
MIFGYKMWISLKIFDGYGWIWMDMDGYSGWISNPVQQVGNVLLEAHIYPYISIDIHRYPTYISIHISMVQVLRGRGRGAKLKP